MTIYTTVYAVEAEGPVALTESADSGMGSFEMVKMMMGDPMMVICSGRALIYDAGDGTRTVYSDFPFNAPKAENLA